MQWRGQNFSKEFGSFNSLYDNCNIIAVSCSFTYDDVPLFELDPTNSSWVLLGEDTISYVSANFIKLSDFDKAISTAVLSGD